MPRFRLAPIVLIAWLVPFSTTADAAPIPTGPEQRVNAATSGRQLRSDVATFADGSTVVVWEGEDGDGRGIFGRRVDATGTPTGTDFAVSSPTADDQTHTRVVTTDAGGFLVVWESEHTADPTIASRFFDAANTPSSVVDVAAAQLDIGVSQPEIAPVEAQRFVVVWDSYDYDTTESAIRGRRLDDTGSIDGMSFDIATAPIGDFAFKGSTAPRSSDGFVLAWYVDDPGRTLFARNFDATGGATGTLATVATSNVFDPRVAGLSGDDALVVWDTASTELQRRRHLSDGTALPPVDVDATDEFATDASVIALPGGAAALAWVEIDGLDYRLLVHLVDSTDALTDVLVVDDVSLSVSDPRLAYDASRAELIVVWTRRGGTGADQEEIYIRRYALDGLFADGFESGNTDAWSAP